MIRLIVACDRKRGIARAGIQPWKLSGDARYFAKMTQQFGATVLMGRTTYDAIGAALPNRHNIVLSNHPMLSDQVETTDDLESLLTTHQDIWVIGGEQLYDATINSADELYVTEIDADFDCDQFFPEYTSLFTLVSRGKLQFENDTQYRFCLYKRASHK